MTIQKQIYRRGTAAIASVFFLCSILLSSVIFPLLGSQSVGAATVRLSSVKNFRDASDTNNILKPSILYRSGELNKLNAKDKQQLAQLLKGGMVIDLREVKQRRGAPDKPISGVKNVHIPIDGILDQRPMVEDAARRAQLKKVLKLAASTNKPVLVHCYAGKDRTGWTVAMIMHISGATRQQIMTEYMKSRQAWPDGVKEHWLNNGLNAADAKYGSLTNYLTKGVGLTNADIQKIRTKFAVKRSGGGTTSGTNNSNGTNNTNTGNQGNGTKSKPSPTGNKSGKFRIASYNILGSNHVEHGSRVGRCGDSKGCTIPRAKNVEDAVEGRSGKAGFDIVGMQEVRNDQLNYFNKNLEAYAHSNVKNASSHTIYWNKGRFKLIKSGGVKYPYFDSGWDTGTWVLLQDKNTDQKFYVFNHHPPAHGGANKSKSQGALKREKSAQIVAEWVDKIYAKDKLPIFVLGDMNSRTTFASNGNDAAYNGNRKRLPYCILTQSGVMRYSFDAKAKRKGPCPLKKNAPGFSVDYVLVSKGVKVYRTGSLDVARASDHKPAYADVSLGAADDDGTPNNSGDKQPPKITITSPADGITIDKGMKVSAKATDAESGIDRVEFFRNDKRIVTDRKAPYMKKWNTTRLPNTPENQPLQVYAIAYDKAGNQMKSAVVKVNIDHRNTQTQKNVTIDQNGKKIAVGMTGLCSSEPKGSAVTTVPETLKSKNVVAGITFSAKCKKAGGGMTVEINLGSRYNHQILRAYKEKSGTVEDITEKITMTDMKSGAGGIATHLMYSITDGNDLDSDGRVDSSITDPLFVTHGDSTTGSNNQNNTNTNDTTDNTDTDTDDNDETSTNTGPVVTHSNPDGSVTVTTADGSTVRTTPDGAVVSGARKGVLPNTGTSAVILLSAGAAATAAWWFVRNRKRTAIRALHATYPQEYTIADIVESQQKEADVVTSKEDTTQ